MRKQAPRRAILKTVERLRKQLHELDKEERLRIPQFKPDWLEQLEILSGRGSQALLIDLIRSRAAELARPARYMRDGNNGSYARAANLLRDLATGKVFFRIVGDSEIARRRRTALMLRESLGKGRRENVFCGLPVQASAHQIKKSHLSIQKLALPLRTPSLFGLLSDLPAIFLHEREPDSTIDHVCDSTKDLISTLFFNAPPRMSDR